MKRFYLRSLKRVGRISSPDHASTMQLLEAANRDEQGQEEIGMRLRHACHALHRAPNEIRIVGLKSCFLSHAVRAGASTLLAR